MPHAQECTKELCNCKDFKKQRSYTGFKKRETEKDLKKQKYRSRITNHISSIFFSRICQLDLKNIFAKLESYTGALHIYQVLKFIQKSSFYKDLIMGGLTQKAHLYLSALAAWDGPQN